MRPLQAIAIILLCISALVWILFTLYDTIYGTDTVTLMFQTELIIGAIIVLLGIIDLTYVFFIDN